MYLSRLKLNPVSRQVRAEIGNPYEMHRSVMQAFAGHLAPDERVLFRLDIQPQSGLPVLLVQSFNLPDWAFLQRADKNFLLAVDGEENPAVKPFNLHLSSGQKLYFRLKAAPSVKKDRPGHKQGRRVALYDEDQQLNWLKRKFEEAGCQLLDTSMQKGNMLEGTYFEGRDKQTFSLFSVLFDGALMVKDPLGLEKTVRCGVGSGKGFGLGLLSLARV